MTDETRESRLAFINETVATLAIQLGFDEVVLIGRTRCDGIGGKEARDQVITYGRDDEHAKAATLRGDHLFRYISMFPVKAEK